MKGAKTASIFEVSWEVCNKVGGIYTVLSTKARALQNMFTDRIIFIGPDFGENYKPDNYTEDDSLLSSLSVDDLPFGIKLRKGRWNIPGEPIALLVDFKGIYPYLDRFYGEMWENFGVDSLHAYGDYDDSCAFSLATGIIIERLNKVSDTGNVIAHFNEWTTGMGLLYLKKNCPDIATIFTTHATSIGRSICGNNKQLYAYFDGYNGDQMAGELNMQSKHSLEKAAAHNSDCFTTVSDITAKECGRLLEIYPHKVTPNGFNKEIAGTVRQQVAKRKVSREKLFKILTSLTGKRYRTDTFIVATSGRNEFRNKGIDMFLDAMSRLRTLDDSIPVIGLVLVPAWVRKPRQDLLDKIDGKYNGNVVPRNITHWLNNPDEDAIYRRIRELGFDNKEDDIVDVIYVPCYLDGKDGVINMSYYDLLPALDYTVFPSYYEPWGYTPLESIAFGVPTVTTRLSGFGQWTYDRHGQKCLLDNGVAVYDRTDSNYKEIVDEISGLLWNWAGKLKSERSDYKEVQKAGRKEAADTDWSKFIRYYLDAYDIAVDKRDKRIKELQKK